MVIAEIVETEIEDPSKNIIVWVNFKHDGTDVPFYKGQELLIRQGKPVWPLYCRYQNFIGKTVVQIGTWIKSNVEFQIGTIIQEILAKPIQTTTIKQKLDTLLIGTTYQKDSVEVQYDETSPIVILKDDGTTV